jgi:transposase
MSCSPSTACTCPLNRQSDVYQREGIDLDVSTLADWVGGSAATLIPLVDAIRSHVFAAERVHADDTTVPLWTYVRDDRPFAGPDPPAAVFFYSPDRGGEHPEQHLTGYAGLMQADAYAGFSKLYEANRKGGPIIEAACRVGGDVAIPAPHRPGRADYPHPVLHA